MNKTLLYLCLPLFLVSCITPDKVLYLQDMDESSQIKIENKYEARISVQDQLSIFVTCSDQTLIEPFNLYGQNMNNTGSNNLLSGYLVDVNGEIDFPILGKIKVQGLTRLELQKLLTDRLTEEMYLEDPLVTIRFSNFKIFYLGAGGGGVLNISNERCTLLEALAMMGGLDNYTRRDKIAVIREVDGKMTMRYLDPRSSEMFNDPYFLLQQNDFVITESIKGQYYKQEVSYWLSWISVFTSISSIVTMLLLL